jgi:hypothetical protein
MVVVSSRLNDRGTLSEYSENGGALKGHLSENALGHFRSGATGTLFSGLEVRQSQGCH